MTNILYLVRTARALLPGFGPEALGFVTRAAAETVDPRLRTLLRAALAAIDAGDPAAAWRWIDRALAYIGCRGNLR